jgi:hypothetical protein
MLLNVVVVTLDIVITKAKMQVVGVFACDDNPDAVFKSRRLGEETWQINNG